MRKTIEAGSILIESGTPMPVSLLRQGEPFADGWTFFRHPNRRDLETSIDEAGLTFFYLAGEIKATVFGFDEEALMMRVAKKLIKNVKAQHWNGLEITRVAMSSFLGVPYATVAGHGRHIQEGLVLRHRGSTATTGLLSAEEAVAAWEDEGGALRPAGGRLAA